MPGFLGKALSSQRGGVLFNFVQDFLTRRDFQRDKREQIDPFNRDLQSVADFGQGIWR